MRFEKYVKHTPNRCYIDTMILLVYLAVTGLYTGHSYGDNNRLQFLYACPLPHVPSGTIYNIFGHRPNDNYVSPKTYVSISCARDYSVQSGHSNSYCSETGVWTRPLGRCLPSGFSQQHPVGHNPTQTRCLAPVISNGYLLTDRYQLPLPLTSYYVDCGSRISLSCDPGYEVQGSVESQCLTTGSWSIPIGRCVLKPPPIMYPRPSLGCDVPVVCNGVISINGGPPIEQLGFVAQIYATIYLRCKDGFVARGQTHATCVGAGSWSNVIGECVVESRPPPPPTPSQPRPPPNPPVEPAWCPLPQEDNGQFQFTSRQAVSGNRVYNGASVFLRCNPGYSPQGSSQFYCSHGSWFPPIRNCALAPTPPPPPPVTPPPPQCMLPSETFGTFFHVTGEMVTTGTVDAGQAVILRCSPGYTAVGGRRSARCIEDRLIPHLATCRSIQPNCTLPTGDPNSRFYSVDGQRLIAATVVRGMTVLMGCSNQNFYVVGPSRSRCSENGTFDPALGNCQPVPKPECCFIPNVSNGILTSQNGEVLSGCVSNGTITILRCEPGYELNPSEFRQATCSGTELFGALGFCRLIPTTSTTPPPSENCGEQRKQSSDELIAAARFGNVAAVDSHLKNSADPNSQDANGWTALMWAANNNHTEIMTKLLECGAQVDMTNTAGSTAIIFSAKGGHAEATSLLLRAGADPNRANIFGSNALSFAAQKGETPVAIILLDNGANIEAKDSDGVTPLLWATKGNYSLTVDLLLKRGANPNEKDNKNFTPLMAASKAGYLEVAILLLNNGAADTINDQDVNGNTAVSLADDFGQTDVADLLVRMGAQRE